MFKLSVITDEVSQNLHEAAEFALKNGRIPVLLCDEKMCSYYKKAGFEIYGKM